MNLVRFLMLLSLAVWLGALIFFPVVAQTSFTTLPSAHLAGLVVRGSLLKLHWMGFSCGVVFLASSLLYNRLVLGRMRALALSHILTVAMLALTALSQFRIIPQLETLRLAAGEVNALAPSDPLRMQFDSLHIWSTRIEGTVLVLGVVVLYALSRRLASSRG
jgi:Domain of unknown function (DUF4149)